MTWHLDRPIINKLILPLRRHPNHRYRRRNHRIHLRRPWSPQLQRLPIFW